MGPDFECNRFNGEKKKKKTKSKSLSALAGLHNTHGVTVHHKM